MKKFFIAIVLVIGCSALTYAQDISENAIGLRLGSNDGFGAEVSYQRALNTTNRIEADLGWRSGNNSSGFKLTGLYQWVWVLDGNFNWYAGAGGGFGSYSYDNPNGEDNNSSFVFAAGNIGVEYNFDIPLLVSLDFRPELGFGKFNDDLGFDVALGVRYQF
jgi:hypothetical protein